MDWVAERLNAPDTNQADKLDAGRILVKRNLSIAGSNPAPIPILWKSKPSWSMGCGLENR